MTLDFDQRLRCSAAAAANPGPIVENRESETMARESPDSPKLPHHGDPERRSSENDHQAQETQAEQGSPAVKARLEWGVASTHHLRQPPGSVAAKAISKGDHHHLHRIDDCGLFNERVALDLGGRAFFIRPFYQGVPPGRNPRRLGGLVELADDEAVRCLSPPSNLDGPPGSSHRRGLDRHRGEPQRLHPPGDQLDPVRWVPAPVSGRATRRVRENGSPRARGRKGGHELDAVVPSGSIFSGRTHIAPAL